MSLAIPSDYNDADCDGLYQPPHEEEYNPAGNIVFTYRYMHEQSHQKSNLLIQTPPLVCIPSTTEMYLRMLNVRNKICCLGLFPVDLVKPGHVQGLLKQSVYFELSISGAHLDRSTVGS